MQIFFQLILLILSQYLILCMMSETKLHLQNFKIYCFWNSYLYNTVCNFSKLSHSTFKNQLIKENLFIFWCQSKEWDTLKYKEVTKKIILKNFTHKTSRTTLQFRHCNKYSHFKKQMLKSKIVNLVICQILFSCS